MPDAPAPPRKSSGCGRAARRRLAALCLLVAGLGAGCSPLKLLRPGQRLLVAVEVQGTDLADEEALLALAQQKPNTTFPLPKLAIYEIGASFYDSVKLKQKLRTIEEKYTQRIEAVGTDSAKLGKLLAKRENKVKRKQLALDKGNAIMRLGEPPVVYDTAATRRSVEQMSVYLDAHGFFRSRVYATDTARNRRGLWRGALHLVGLHKDKPRRDSAGNVRPPRRVTVTYHVDENKPFTYSQLTYTIPDSGVAQIVQRHASQRLLQVGDRYNEDKIGQERQRLETLIRNAGYYDFREQYITLEADTSFAPYTVRLRTLIASPGPGQPHRRYTLRRVRMVTDAGVQRTLRAAATDTLGRLSEANRAERRRLRRLRGGGRRDTLTADSVRFAAFELKYNPKLLARKITLRPNQNYSLTRTQQTQHLLSDLDMFRFNTVTYRKVEETLGLPQPRARSAAPDPTLPAGRAMADTLNYRAVKPVRPAQAEPDTATLAALPPATGQLDAIISASPAPKFTETTEFGGTYVANLPGPFINVRLKTRNPFGGAEVLELGVRAGFEGQFTRVGTGTEGTNQYTTQFGATAALFLPQFLVPFRTNQFLTRYNPKTRFSLSETFVSRPEYTRSNFEFTFDYIWQKSLYQQYVVSPVVVNIVNAYDITATYQKRLEELRTIGSPLFRSFTQLFEPSMSFTSLYNSNDFSQTRDAHYLRGFVEVGGLTRGLYRDELRRQTGLLVYNFAKATLDFRRYHHLSPRTFLVWRLNGGVAHALTPTDGQYTIPYDKYLFAGGSNSVRAWQPRRLGVGSYLTQRVNADGVLVRDIYSEQPGEVLLEGSVEYRFPVYSFLKGALFTDFGNVWTLQNDSLRPGAEFQPERFYREFAVGSGIGIRLDFSFLILRLDIAAKVYDPTEPEGRRWVLRDFAKDAYHRPTFNLGIGYPF